MLNIGGPELLVILLVALVVLGPDKLPGAARQVGRTVTQLRSMAQGFQQELQAAASPDAPAAATNPEHIRTAAKASGAEVFGGSGIDASSSADDDATQDHKPVSPGGPGGAAVAAAAAVGGLAGASTESAADEEEE